MKNFLLLIAAFFLAGSLSGCSDLIRSLREEGGQQVSDEDDTDNTERELAARRSRGVNGLSANNVSAYEPPASRTYGRRLASRLEDEAAARAEAPAYSPGPEFHRVTRADFIDRAPADNSLWDGQGQTNYLFANNRQREVGDLLTVDVEKELRREIQFQLWMTLPPEQRMIKKTAGDSVANTAAGLAKDGSATGDKLAKAQEKSAEQKQKDAAEEAAKTNMAPATKEDDLIKMEVVESLGNGLVRVLGQKRVIYRGVSRLVEVVAIVNNKDIDDSNRSKSSAFLDTKAQVIQ